MRISTITITWASLFVVIAYVYRKWNNWRVCRAVAIKHGCQPPPKYPHTDRFWGYDLVKRRAEAIKDGGQMDLYTKHFDMYGKTWEENALETKVINTMEKLNIQQVAALGFEDYGKPSRKVFAPFLGDGIFSQDGPKWKHSRELVKSTFSRAELSDVGSLELHANRLVELIPRDGSTVPSISKVPCTDW